MMRYPKGTRKQTIGSAGGITAASSFAGQEPERNISSAAGGKIESEKSPVRDTSKVRRIGGSAVPRHLSSVTSKINTGLSASRVNQTTVLDSEGGVAVELDKI